MTASSSGESNTVVTREWKPGDRALLPVVMVGLDTASYEVEYLWGPNPRYLHVRPGDLIPDDHARYGDPEVTA